MKLRSRCGWAALLSVILHPPTSAADDSVPPAQARPIVLTVRAGAHDRQTSLLRFKLPASRLGPNVIKELTAGPVALTVRQPGGATSRAQVARQPDGDLLATWFLPEPIPAGGEARFELVGDLVADGGISPWSVTEADPGAWEIRNRGRMLFRYNAAPVPAPAGPLATNPRLIRNSYIHPAFSPAGALVTGDFSAYHPHHRGFFLAYVHTKWGDLAPDFWNIQNGTGRIVAEGVDRPRVGPVSVRLDTRHRWEALNPKLPIGAPGAVALRERWAVEVFDVPGSPCWLFDLTSTQQAEGHPLELLPYRYGGMAYRSAEPSVRGPLDVLTAEGKHRFDGDQQPTRWVDLTGPVAENSPNYAGAFIADHPANPHFPGVARIHPVTLPFFCFVPAHDQLLTIPLDQSRTWRYRIMIHDGRPDPAFNDRIAADFADPAVVEMN